MKKLRKSIILFIIILAFSGYVKASRSEGYLSYPTQEYIFPNGLKFINRAVPDSKLSTIELLVKVGAAREGKYLGYGLSHFTEHMLFKANKKYAPGQIHKIVRKWGGSINGFTGYDYTHYKITVLEKYLPQAVSLVNDIMFKSDFKEKLFKKEKNVILNEIKMKKDEPGYVANRLVFNTLYEEHTYKTPVIGYEEKVREITLEKLKDFYNIYYTPSNMIISIVGPGKHFRNYKVVKNNFPTATNFYEKNEYKNYKVREQLSPKGRIRIYPTDLIHLNLTYPSIDIKSEDLYALDVLASILGQGGSSRLNEELNIKRGLVRFIGVYNYTPLDKGIFDIYASTTSDKLKKTIKAIFKEIKQIKKGNIKSTEIKKAVNRVESSEVFSLQTVQAQASSLVSNEFMTDDYNFDQQYLEKVKKVTKRDVIRVAKKYLNSEKYNLTMVIPEDEKIKFVENLLNNENYISDYSNEEVGVEVDINRLEALLFGKKQEKIPQGKITGFKKYTLSNGITILINKDSTLPIASVRCLFKGGVRAEDKYNNGLSSLTASLLLGGTSSLTKSEILEEIEEVGGSISVDSGYNTFSIGLEILSEKMDKGLKIIFDIIKNSNFPKRLVKIEKKRQKQAVKAIKDSIFDIGLKNLRHALFVKHPYKFMKVGTISSINNITREDIVKFYKKYVRPENLVFTVVGDVEPKRIRDTIEKNLGDWENDEKQVSINPPKQVKLNKVKEKKVKVDKKQHLLMYGFRGIKITNEDRYPLEALNRIISGGGSRLWQSIRGKKGLAYSLGSYFVPGIDTGYIAIYILTRSESLEKIKKYINKQIEIIKKGKFTEKELKTAKNELIGNDLSNLQSLPNLSYRVSLDEMYGLGYKNYTTYEENINSVEKEDIVEIANKYFTLDNCVVLKILPKGRKKKNE